ncbi:trypsin-like peptidase domain-containing protein [Streptomyces sp. NPDC012751]|uniref:trypsin-like peptidase domain-containing protein n=1 Tax=Streptomyces sp. NPDC012751 TaxID=3364846 RepID=UPI0036751179
MTVDGVRAPVPGYLGRVLDAQATAVGTCFQVAPGLLVTACHVLEDLGAAVEGAQVLLDPLAGGEAFTGTVASVDAVHDLALIHGASVLPACVAGWARADNARPGTEVMITGAPTVADFHSYRYLDARGTCEGAALRDGVLPLLRVKADAVQPGMSGAPVRRAGDDRVIGVLSARYNSVDGWLPHTTWITRAEDVAPLLAEHAPVSLPEIDLPPGVRTHEQELARLHGKKFLTRDQLPFVTPDDRHPAAPAQLLATLSAPPAPGSTWQDDPVRGVVLIGAAGAGKTRACFEVAASAEARQWRVFHIGADAQLSVEQLVSVVAARPGGRVLLVFDYFDNYTGLDLKALSEELHGTQVKVAFLASIRPGALEAARRQHSGIVFEEVTLQQDADYQERICRAIFEKVAPEALRRWSERELAELCGRRPVIALLIAREIEARLQESLAVSELSSLKKTDLLGWLTQRLEEDFSGRHGAEGAASGGPAETEPWLLASTIAAASCAQGRDAVEAVVDHYRETCLGRSFRQDGPGVVARLVKLGWLLDSDGELDVVHDIVTDQLLQRALFPDSLELHGLTAREFFSTFLLDARTFGRAVGHLRRWAADLEPANQEEVRGAFGRWLTTNATALGELLAGDAEEGGRTLLSLLSGEPWQDASTNAWDRLVRPWLRAVEDAQPWRTRALFANAVRSTADAVPEVLVTEALAWLDGDVAWEDARQVVAALTRAPGLPERQVTTVISLALDRLAVHGTTPGAMDVVSALLARNDLAPETAASAVDRALAWVQVNRRLSRSCHVLRVLLLRADLSTRQESDAVAHALAWLKSFGPLPNDYPSFVLRPLLAGARLTRRQASWVVRFTLAWLTDRREDGSASYVLSALLKRQDLTPAQLSAAATEALAWMSARRDGDISYVLRPLLLRRDLDAEQAAAAVTLAVGWLGGPHVTSENYVIPALLAREDLEPEQTAEALRAALAWLRAHGTTEHARFLLDSLLERPLPDEDTAAQVVGHALNWLTENFEHERATYIIQALLERPRLDHGTAAQVVEHALNWLTENSRHERATFVFKALLELRRLDGDTVAQVVDHALGWLDLHHEAATVPFALEPLLRQRGLDEEQRAAVLANAFAWLARHETDTDARFVLQPLLYLFDLSAEQTRRTVGHADAWLAAHRPDPATSFVLEPLLIRHDLSPGASTRAVQHTLAWLDAHGPVDFAWRLLKPLLTHPDPVHGYDPHTGEYALRRVTAAAAGSGSAAPAASRRPTPQAPRTGARIVRHTLAWLDVHGVAGQGNWLLAGLLRRPDVPAQIVRCSAAAALDWLDSRSPRTQTRLVDDLLCALLLRDDLDPEQQARTFDRAMTVSAAHVTARPTSRVLRILLVHPALDAARRALVAGMALRWLDVQGAHLRLLLPLLDTPGLTPQQAKAAADHALNRLERDSTDSRAHRLVGRLAHLPDLTGTQRARLRAALPPSWEDSA